MKLIIALALTFIQGALGNAVLLDNKVDLRVPGGPVPVEFNLALKDTKTPDKFRVALTAVRRAIMEAKGVAQQALDAESRAVGDIIGSYPNDGTYREPSAAAAKVIEEEKKEWDLRLETVDRYPTSTTIFTYDSMKKAVEGYKATVDAEYTAMMARCGSRHLLQCINNVTQHRNFVKSVKTALMSLQIFLGVNLNNTRSSTGMNPSELFRSELKFLVDKINHGGRFAISPIARDMNFQFLLKRASDKANLVAVGNALKLKYRQLAFRVKESKDVALMADMALRKLVVDGMLADPEEEGKTLSKEILAARVKGFERLAQGQIRTLQDGLNPSAQVDKFVKMWQMAEQMFTKNGWKEVDRYGLLPVPSGLQLTLEDFGDAPVVETSSTPTPTSEPVPTPVTVEGNELKGKRVRSDTLDTVASTDSNVSAPPHIEEKPKAPPAPGIMSGFMKSIFGS